MKYKKQFSLLNDRKYKASVWVLEIDVFRMDVSSWLVSGCCQLLVVFLKCMCEGLPALQYTGDLLKRNAGQVTVLLAIVSALPAN